MGTPEPQTTDNLATRVLGRLRTDLLHGYYAPGSKLPMAALKQRYGVGVSPLREALSHLIAEDLVVVENQRGYRVQSISRHQLQDIYRARAHLEALCLGLAIDDGDDAWEAGVLAAAHRLGKTGALDRDAPVDLQEWESRHHAFHTALVAGCGSDELLRARESLYDRAARYRNLWLRENAGRADAFDANQLEHQQLVDAALARRRDEATELVLRHLMVPVEVLEGSVDGEGFR